VMGASAAMRPARPSDLPEIRRLLDSCGLPSGDLDASGLAGFLVLAGAEGIGAVGGLEVYGDSALLRSVAVASERRGRRLGTAVVEALEVLARSRGIRRLFLLTTTAEEFFRRLGYAPVGRASVPVAIGGTSEFRGICPSTAVCMQKTLG
jgi:amino-acid N-acetyltransferase